MRTETIAKAVALAVLSAVPLGCGASGSSGASTAAASSTGGAPGTSTGGTTGGGSSTGGSTGAPLTGLGDSCTYNVSSGDDTCAKFGLECTSLISWVFCEGLDYPCPPTASNRGGAGTCALPQEIGPCDQAIGCQDAGPSPDGESDDFVCAGDTKDGYACFYQCTQSSDCANITETCQTIGGSHVCSYNYCEPMTAYTHCDDLGSGDGECLSWGGGAAAVCYQNGTVADGAACKTYRENGSGDSQCVFGDFCVPTPSDQTVGVCMPVAAASGSSHACPSTSDTVWVDVLGADFGVCVPACPSDGGACPANLSCRSSIPGVGEGCVP